MGEIICGEMEERRVLRALWVVVTLTLACTVEEAAEAHPERANQLLHSQTDGAKWLQGVVQLDEEAESSAPVLQAQKFQASAEKKMITARTHELTAKKFARMAIETGHGDPSEAHAIIKTGGRAAAQTVADVATTKMNAEHEANQKLKLKLKGGKKGGEKAAKAAKKAKGKLKKDQEKMKKMKAKL